MLMPDEKYQMGSVSRQMSAMRGTMYWMGRQDRPRRTAWAQAQRHT